MANKILYVLLVFIAVDMCQLHQVISPLKYLKLGFISQTILIIFCMVNLFRYQGGKKLLLWRFLFLIAISTGLLFGYSPGKVRAVFEMDVVRYFAGLLGVCLIVKTLNDFTAIMKLLMVTSLLVSVFVITHGGIGPGMICDENDAASFLVMLLPIPYFMSFITEKKLPTLMCRSIFVINLGAIAMTLSRGGMVGALPTLLFIWFKSKRKVLSLVFFVIVMAGVVRFGPQNLLTEFYSIQETEEGTAADRQYYWKISTDIFLVKPIFGIGANSWGQAVWSGIVPLEKNVGNLTAHSMYFQLISELGSFGILIFIAFVVTIIRIVRSINVSIRNAKLSPIDSPEESKRINTMGFYSQALVIGLFGFAICSIFISTLYYPHFYYYAFFLQALGNVNAYYKNEMGQNDVDV